MKPLGVSFGPSRSRSGAPAFLSMVMFLLPLLPVVLSAHSPESGRELTGELVDVRVMVDERATALFEAPGRPDRRYFEAVRGRNYALAIRNNSGERVGVLITVDGLNVVNGERSKLKNHEAMYVLGPWEETEIRGWRTSLDEVRRFVFVDEKRSYAERSGQANGDLGWIRVMAFREVGGRWLRDRGEFDSPGERSRDEAGNRASSPAAGPKASSEMGQSKAEAGRDMTAERQRDNRDDASPGTGWGERSHDVVQRTWFEPEAAATDRFTLRYEYASGLRALGIEDRHHRNRLRERENGDFGFARPPKR